MERNSGTCNGTDRWMGHEEGAAQTVPCWSAAAEDFGSTPCFEFVLLRGLSVAGIYTGLY